jgi:hypothetical protein
MSKGALIIVSLALVGVAFFGGFRYGSSAGYSDGHKAGYEKGFSEAPKPDYFTVDQLRSANSQLLSDYNKLVDDYNSLRDAAIRYVGATQYQAQAPITCSSYSYGINSQFSSTTCY